MIYSPDTDTTPAPALSEIPPLGSMDEDLGHNFTSDDVGGPNSVWSNVTAL